MKNSGREFRTTFPPRDIRKNPRSMYARVPQAMAQFVLKIELLSHIMGTTPILEMARAYGLRPRLWLLIWTGSKYFWTIYKNSVFLRITPTALQEYSPFLKELKKKTPGRDTYSRSHLRSIMGWEILAHINFIFSRKFSRV